MIITIDESRIWKTRTDLAASIDDAVAAIYARYNRFGAEYTEREAQAQDYKNAGYTGDVPVQVAAFATPAGNTGQQAADIILSQAAQLRGALSQLGVLRMRKFEVLAAPDAATAQAIADATLRRVAQIECEYAHEIARSHPIVQQVAETLEISESDMDALFTLAGGL